MEDLHTGLILRSLNFHGQQLQKVWESERGDSDWEKQKIIPSEIKYDVYQLRQKDLSFQDRGKRLKLHQFIAKKAPVIFNTHMMDKEPAAEKAENHEDIFAVMPPYESFLQLEKNSRMRHFFQVIKNGDVVIGTITSKTVSGMMIKILCTVGEGARCVADLNVKAFCPSSSVIPAVDKKQISRNYMVGDSVCCEVLEVIADTDKLVCGMKGVNMPANSELHPKLGLIHSDDFPVVYKKSQDLKDDSYENVLEKCVGFNNPNSINYLSGLMGLGSSSYSFFDYLKGKFPDQEYAPELRQLQASKWAFKSVAEGIDHFKGGRTTEAFQCLNKALTIDPRHVEGLVARGALYANSGSFQKAIEDFESALKINHNHQNARKYMAETLNALGRSFEDENKLDEALKSFEHCLALIPYHEEAKKSLELLKTKINNSKLTLNDADVAIPGLSSTKTLEVKETLKQLLKREEDDDKKDKEKSKQKKKKEKRSRKRRHRSSSSSSSSSSASSRSSTSTSSSSTESSSASSRSHSNSRSPSKSRKSKKRRKNSRRRDDKEEKSLSPLSKRMALMDPVSQDTEGLGVAQRLTHYNPPAIPIGLIPNTSKMDDFEQKVYRFFEQTKGDSEYEDKVRKFLDESAKWKKEKKVQDDKSKKKKKKEKKSRDKDKSKKKKREREDHDKKKKRRNKKNDKFDAKEFEEQLETKKLREALRKEFELKEEMIKQKSVDEEEEFLYGVPPPVERKEIRMERMEFETPPSMVDLLPKINTYYKIEKDAQIPKREEKLDKKSQSNQAAVKHISPKLSYSHESKSEELRVKEKKKMDIFAKSPSPQDGKNKIISNSANDAANANNSKWKMQINSASKIKKKDKTQVEKEPWEEGEEKRFVFRKESEKPESEVEDDEEVEEGEIKKKKLPGEDKYPGRKGMLMSEKINSEKIKKEIPPPEIVVPEPPKAQAYLDKFGNFRRAIDKKDLHLPQPTSRYGVSRKGARGIRTNSDISESSDSELKKKKRQTSRGSSRSRSRSRDKYSRDSSNSSSHPRSYLKNRSRSKSGSYDRKHSRSGSYVRYESRSRSRSYNRYRSSASRSRSRSYRSRSHSYRYSRSHSRSIDGHYHRRSRSMSDDRRRYGMNKYQGRYPRNRGTYYRPRFQNFKNARGYNGPRVGRNFQSNRNQNFRDNRQFMQRRGRGGPRGRYFHYNKPSSGNRYYPRRYDDRPRSRDRDRDSIDRRSYSHDDMLRKRDGSKDRIKYSDRRKSNSPRPSRKKDESLSEGEERDEEEGECLTGDLSPRNNADNKRYEGKNKDSDDKISLSKVPEGPRLPPENSFEELDKFLNKVKPKKDEGKERKSYSKEDW